MMNILNLLKEYYGIDINDYKEYKEGIIFFVNGSYYLFTKCHFNEAYVSNITRLCDYAKSKGIKLHDFVYNKEYKFISKEYILFKVNVFMEEIDFDDVMLFNSVDCNSYNSDYIFMDKFWEDKIDYLELQLSELSNNKLLNNSFDYYVGIAEELIDYLRKNYDKKNINLRLSHKCLKCLDSLEYYNPLNISVDLPYKDIAAFLRRKGDTELLVNLIDKAVNTSDYGYFFVRMVFPFKYFHEIEEILVDGKDNNELIQIVNKVTNYEEYLWEIEKFFGIYLFDWIKKSN